MRRRSSPAAVRISWNVSGGFPSGPRARALTVLSSTPALVCLRTNGKSEARTASAVHPNVAHHGRPVITCACSMAVAAMPTGSNDDDASIRPLVAATAASPEMVSPTRSVTSTTVSPVDAPSAPFAPR